MPALAIKSLASCSTRAFRFASVVLCGSLSEATMIQRSREQKVTRMRPCFINLLGFVEQNNRAILPPMSGTLVAQRLQEGATDFARKRGRGVAPVSSCQEEGATDWKLVGVNVMKSLFDEVPGCRFARRAPCLTCRTHRDQFPRVQAGCRSCPSRIAEAWCFSLFLLQWCSVIWFPSAHMHLRKWDYPRAATGGSLVYDPRDGSTRTVLRDLKFPNGIAIASDKQSIRSPRPGDAASSATGSTVPSPVRSRW